MSDENKKTDYDRPKIKKGEPIDLNFLSMGGVGSPKGHFISKKKTESNEDEKPS